MPNPTQRLAAQGGDGLRPALLIWLAAAAVLVACLPLIPIDETRYMTVAWEMRLSDHWLLPTLNGEPYSHKPPLLMWLINLAWSLGGPSVAAARAVPVLTTVGVMIATHRLARTLFPDNAAMPGLATLLTLMPAFLLYGALIMFDQLLTLFVVMALLALWRAAQEPSWRSWTLLGIALGLGMLAKGPVVLLHSLPAAALVRLWKPDGATQISWQRWTLGLLGAILLGTAMILAWAIPAAITGGPEFARMIFWEQSAGRMVKSFAHRLPIWFYLPVLAAFFFPLLVWQPFWRGLASAKAKPLPQPVKLLLTWIVTSIVAFSLISGKQPHYLLPLVPGVAILAAWLVQDTKAKSGDIVQRAILGAIPFVIIALAPLLATVAHFGRSRLAEAVVKFDPLVTIAAGVAAVAALSLAHTLKAQAQALALTSLLLIGTIAVQARSFIFPFYDLTPIAAAMQQRKDTPLAYTSEYHGELGYLAQLEKPLEVIPPSDLDAWFAKNPNGFALSRQQKTSLRQGYETVLALPYRAKEHFTLVRKSTSPTSQ